MKKTGFIKGAIIAYIFIIIVKLLGVIYVIPFYNIIGEEGGVLYTYAYSIYNLFLNIAASGIPIAISIIVSEYIALKKIKTKELVYSLSNKIISIISFSAFLILFLFAKQIGSFYVSGIEGTTSISDIALVIRSVSFCLLIIPFLSVTRGYLQGHKYIKESSISELIEQLVRISFALVSAYIVINLLSGEVSVGVGVSLLGAFLGGVVAFIYLKRKIKKNNEISNELINKNEVVDDKKVIIKKIIKYSIPIIIIAIVNDIYQITDIKLVIKGLYLLGFDGATSELISSIMSTWSPKICVIVVAISMAITASLIPHIAENYVNKNYKELNKKINKSISLCLLIALPSVLGINILSNLLYQLFYGYSEYGAIILKYVAIVNGFVCIHKIFNIVLQSMGKFKIIYLNTITGVIINIILDIPLIFLFNKLGLYPYLGALLSSSIGYIISILIVVKGLKKEIGFSFKDIFKNFTKMILPLVCMGVVIFVLNKLIDISSFRYYEKVLLLLFYGFIGATIYFFITYKNKLLEDILEKDTLEKIFNKLKIKAKR